MLVSFLNLVAAVFATPLALIILFLAFILGILTVAKVIGWLLLPSGRKN